MAHISENTIILTAGIIEHEIIPALKALEREFADQVEPKTGADKAIAIQRADDFIREVTGDTAFSFENLAQKVRDYREIVPRFLEQLSGRRSTAATDALSALKSPLTLLLSFMSGGLALVLPIKVYYDAKDHEVRLLDAQNVLKQFMEMTAPNEDASNRRPATGAPRSKMDTGPMLSG